jgi:plastocyanin
MPHRLIKVSLVNDTHVCDPRETKVKTGDTVEWEGTGGEELTVTFPLGTPLFKEGTGPRSGSDTWTVEIKAPLQKGKRFTPHIKMNGVDKPNVGDIIVDDE